MKVVDMGKGMPKHVLVLIAVTIILSTFYSSTHTNTLEIKVYAIFQDEPAFYSGLEYNLTDKLEITISASKSIYNVGEELKINGTLLLIHDNASFPVPGQLVALQINDRVGQYVLRTVETAPGVSSSEWQINISSAYIGDSNGNQLTVVTRGQIVYTYLTYHNNWNTPLYVVAAYTVFDANNVPLYSNMPISYTIPPGTNITVRDVWKVPSYAASGTAQLCVSAFSNTPSSGGYPYCPEKLISFAISSSKSTATSFSVAELSETTGTYVAYVTTSKKADTSIPAGTRIGNYTVYVAAKYGVELTANASTTFQIKLMGDVDQVQNPYTGVYSVNILDAIKMAQAFNSKLGDQNWNPNADFNGDNKVNILDAITLSANFGNQAL